MSWRATGRMLRALKQTRGVNKKPPDQIKKWNIRKGDTIDLCVVDVYCMDMERMRVQILAGRDKGNQGQVILIDKIFSRLFVQGMNTHMVYVDAGTDFKGKMQREAPLHYSNVALVDPEDGEPCRIRYKYTESGEKVRVSRRSGRVIPWPVENKDMSRIANPDGPMDTKGDASSRVTYIPSLVTFEEAMTEKFNHLQISPPNPTPSPSSSTQDSTTTT